MPLTETQKKDIMNIVLRDKDNNFESWLRKGRSYYITNCVIDEKLQQTHEDLMKKKAKVQTKKNALKRKILKLESSIEKNRKMLEKANISNPNENKESTTKLEKLQQKLDSYEKYLQRTLTEIDKNNKELQEKLTEKENDLKNFLKNEFDVKTKIEAGKAPPNPVTPTLEDAKTTPEAGKSPTNHATPTLEDAKTTPEAEKSPTNTITPTSEAPETLARRELLNLAKERLKTQKKGYTAENHKLLDKSNKTAVLQNYKEKKVKTPKKKKAPKKKEKPLIQRLNEKLNSQQAITPKDKNELKSYILTTLNENSKAPSSRSLLYAKDIYEEVTKTTTDIFLNKFEKAYNSSMSNHSFTKANNTTTNTAHRELKLAFEVTQKINDPYLQETAKAQRKYR